MGHHLRDTIIAQSYHKLSMPQQVGYEKKNKNKKYQQVEYIQVIGSPHTR